MSRRLRESLGSSAGSNWGAPGMQLSELEEADALTHLLSLGVHRGGGTGCLLGHQLELASSTNILIAMSLTFGLRMVSV
ncbi:MAG: hypothetical protein GY792_00675 [Gammaproteobacteria bacterium]|nr:hypothetical protein [Gammaproteobacteria bacterium]